MHGLSLTFIASLTITLAAPIASATGVPNYDFQWATIGDVNNPAYDGPNLNGFPGPDGGSVDYTYRISKLEITASQWLEFANAFAPLGDPFQIGGQVAGRGAIVDVFGPNGHSFALRPGPDAANRYVGSISWRNAARYCNWLHNDKQVSLAALSTGAYDTSAYNDFANPTAPIWNDASAHLPGAKFWIPTVDEWLKAVHYDPDKGGSGQGGWWLYPNGSDSPPIPGQSPLTGGTGETNANYEGNDPLSYRVGAYPNSRTPWGLLDASGGVSEWIENWNDVEHSQRIYDGSSAESVFFSESYDRAWGIGSNFPNDGAFQIGLRIASAVPGPSAAFAVLVTGLLSTSRMRSRA